MLLCLAGTIGCCPLAGSEAAYAIEYAKPVSNRLNTTGRAIDMIVPFKEGEREIGSVTVRVNPDDTLLVRRDALLQALADILDVASREKLNAITGTGPFLSLRDVEAAGYDIRFDPAQQELRFNPAVAQLAPSDIDASRRNRAPVSSTLASPAYASGYVNLYASLDHQWDSGAPGGTGSDTSGRLQMDSAMRIGGLVFENSGVVAGSVNVNVCPTAAVCPYPHAAGVKRQLSRLIYDMPESRVRSEIGDVEPLGTGFQRTPDLLGFSIEKSGRKLTPENTLAPSGSGSFVVERPSKVEIRINGVVQQQLQLRPGTYNLRDLPLTTGANDVDIVIIDDTGRQQTITHTSFFDPTLLAEGKSEWGATAGLPSYFRDEERDYLPDLYMASAFFRYGIYDGMTAEADLQANKHLVMAGVGALLDTGMGLLDTRAAVSGGENEPGFAIGIDWRIVNFRGLTGAAGESFRFSGEYRSPSFHSPGDIDTADAGIIYPVWNYWLNLDANWSAPVGYDTTLSLSARYQFVNNAEFGNTFYAWKNDRYGADLTLSRPLTSTISGSLAIGVSNELLLSAFDTIRNPDPEFRIGVRLFGRPDEHTSITAGYDSIHRQSDLSAYRSEGNGVGRWDTSVYVQQNEFDDRSSVSATAGYYGNRAQVRVIHNSGFDGVAYPGFDINPGPQLTSVQVGTAVAFADGKFAVGAPVTGDAFAIVYPHKTIADNQITVGSDENIKAVADGWGPALVTSIPAYSPSAIPVDVDDLPVGYSLGPGTFDTFAPLKAGYAFEVGSDYSVSAYGTLMQADGDPVSLISGIARSLEHTQKSIAIFTNSAGRFGADGLASGHWIIEMDTDATPTTFRLDIPAGTEGAFKAGTLYPEATK